MSPICRIAVIAIPLSFCIYVSRICRIAVIAIPLSSCLYVSRICRIAVIAIPLSSCFYVSRICFPAVTPAFSDPEAFLHILVLPEHQKIFFCCQNRLGCDIHVNPLIGL